MQLPESLYEFAFCHTSNFDWLANIAADEYWGDDNYILRNYFTHLYERLYTLHEEYYADADDPHIVINDDIACINTGLYTDRYENIYALFVPNTRVDAAQNWYLRGFYKTSDPDLTDIESLPHIIPLFDDPADLVYDYRLPIRPNIDHILGNPTNLSRVPEWLRDPDKALMLHRLFEGAIKEAERRVTANFRLAVPQFYNGHVQLLLPLCLTGDAPELALAIQREDGFYSARTCLTVDMAYNNARLLSRPEVSWIVPKDHKGKAN